MRELELKLVLATTSEPELIKILHELEREGKKYCRGCKKKIPQKSKFACDYSIFLKEGVKLYLCINCSVIEERKYMFQEGRTTLYLFKKENNGYYLTDCIGNLRFEVTNYSRSRHNMGGYRYDVWFNNYDDMAKWHGYNIGENTQVCHCKRTMTSLTDNEKTKSKSFKNWKIKQLNILKEKRYA